jgi:hypothetical protein
MVFSVSYKYQGYWNISGIKVLFYHQRKILDDPENNLIIQFSLLVLFLEQ